MGLFRFRPEDQMFTAVYLREQSLKFTELAAAARHVGDQDHYGALSKVYECLAETLANEGRKSESIVAPQAVAIEAMAAQGAD
jgi:hypothetical protein